MRLVYTQHISNWCMACCIWEQLRCPCPSFDYITRHVLGQFSAVPQPHTLTHLSHTHSTHSPHGRRVTAALPPHSLHNITCISQYSSRGVFSLSASLVLQQALLIRNFRTALCSSVHHTSKQHCDPSISSILFACVCVWVMCLYRIA